MSRKVVLKCGTGEGMVSVVECDGFCTDVRFGFSPERVMFLGKVSPSVLERLAGDGLD